MLYYTPPVKIHCPQKSAYLKHLFLIERKGVYCFPFKIHGSCVRFDFQPNPNIGLF